jgi:hypothetical protein
MKSLKSIAVVTLFFSLSLFVLSCGGNHNHDHADHSHDTTEAAAKHGEGKEFTSAYVCPMHCETSGSEEPGNCPVCGMEYVAQADHVKDGHSH